MFATAQVSFLAFLLSSPQFVLGRPVYLQLRHAIEKRAATECVATVTVTATGAPVASPTGAVTVSVGNTASTSGSADIGNFGKCSVPKIEFGVGFDGRRETSFQPADKTSYNHGSAQNIDIIIQSICDTLTNSCGADATAKATCAKAQAAADAQTPKRGIQADAFNAAFNIITDFAAVTAVDDQGNEIPGSAIGGGADAADTGNASSAATSAANAATETAAAPAATGDAGSIGNFGICSVPKIEFGVGFDNRKETSFQPADKTSYDHGSAQNIDIIAQFECDTLVNKCKADATAVATCKKAQAAAQNGSPKTGQQADFFNAVFGETTNFATIPPVDDQGNVVQTAAASGNAATTAAKNPPAATKAATTAAAAATASAGNLQHFTGALGGVTPPAVTAVGNGQFQVDGNSAFNNLQNALVRSCDVQHNKCADQANRTGNKGGLTVAACGDQQTQCNAQAKA